MSCNVFAGDETLGSRGQAVIDRTSSKRWSDVQRAGLTSLVSAVALVLLNESPVWGVGRVVVASKTANATNGGALLLAMGAGILILGGGGFTILTWSRRKRAPQQCAPEREALEMAEQAVRYWEGALTHLQHAAKTQGIASSDSPSAEGAPPESQASLLEKAKSGHAQALQVRDERQLELIRCMAMGGGKVPLSNPYTPKLEPVIFDTERPTPPPAPLS
jgi:hypothetical protein